MKIFVSKKILARSNSFDCKVSRWNMIFCITLLTQNSQENNTLSVVLSSSIPYFWSHSLIAFGPGHVTKDMGWSKYLILQENELWRRLPHWNRIQCAWCRNASLHKIYTQPCLFTAYNLQMSIEQHVKTTSTNLL